MSPSKCKFIWPKLYFNKLLLLKVYKILAKKVQRSCLMTLKNDAKFEKKKKFVVSKMTRIWWYLIQAIKSLKNFHFDWSDSSKVYNFWHKKVQKGYLSYDNEEPCTIWRKTGLWFAKWYEESFHQNTWKCQNWYFHRIV